MRLATIDPYSHLGRGGAVGLNWSGAADPLTPPETGWLARKPASRLGASFGESCQTTFAPTAAGRTSTSLTSLESGRWRALTAGAISNWVFEGVEVFFW